VKRVTGPGTDIVTVREHGLTIATDTRVVRSRESSRCDAIGAATGPHNPDKTVAYGLLNYLDAR
jgi:hypothetical protein